MDACTWYNVDQVEKGMKSNGTLLNLGGFPHNYSNEAYIQGGVYNIYAHTTIHTQYNITVMMILCYYYIMVSYYVVCILIAAKAIINAGEWPPQTVYMSAHILPYTSCCIRQLDSALCARKTHIALRIHIIYYIVCTSITWKAMNSIV